MTKARNDFCELPLKAPRRRPGRNPGSKSGCCSRSSCIRTVDDVFTLREEKNNSIKGFGGGFFGWKSCVRFSPNWLYKTLTDPAAHSGEHRGSDARLSLSCVPNCKLPLAHSGANHALLLLHLQEVTAFY